jgi:hypothetical protein
MDARAKKLAHVYGISSEEAQVLVDAGLVSPRKVKKGKLTKVKLPKSVKDKIKARG